MNILQEILKSQGGGDIVGQLAKQFGVNAGDAEKALSNLIPAIAGGIKKTAKSPSGLESLIAKMQGNRDLGRAVDMPDILGKPETTQAGNDILGDIFGSKDVSRTVASQTAQSTGLDLGMLKKMLPVITGVVMSSLNKRGQASGGGLGDLLSGLAGGGAAARSQPKPASGLGALLGGLFGGSRKQQAQPQASGLESLLDFDGDGNVSDDMLDLVKKMF